MKLSFRNLHNVTTFLFINFNEKKEFIEKYCDSVLDDGAVKIYLKKSNYVKYDIYCIDEKSNFIRFFGNYDQIESLVSNEIINDYPDFIYEFVCFDAKEQIYCEFINSTLIDDYVLNINECDHDNYYSRINNIDTRVFDY